MVVQGKRTGRGIQDRIDGYLMAVFPFLTVGRVIGLARARLGMGRTLSMCVMGQYANGNQIDEIDHRK